MNRSSIFSAILGGVKGFAHGSGAANTGTYRTASRYATHAATTAGNMRALRFAGRATSGIVRGGGALAGKPAFYLPLMAGALTAGFAKGVGGELMKDPVSFAWAMDASNSNGGGFNQRNPLGTPLGVYNENPNYMVSPWRLPPNNPLLAGGELMLATFATRHGR